jgi:hypothetical protein
MCERELREKIIDGDEVRRLEHSWGPTLVVAREVDGIRQAVVARDEGQTLEEAHAAAKPLLDGWFANIERYADRAQQGS